METEENGILGECNSDEFLSTGTIRINTALMENGQLLTGDSSSLPALPLLGHLIIVMIGQSQI